MSASPSGARMRDFIKGLWPRSFITWLGVSLSALSVLKLIEFGFNFGLGPTFVLLLTYYENLVHAVIGWWAEPIVKAWLADLGAYFGCDLHLYPHWKHVFVLIGIYFFRQVALFFAVGDAGMGIFLFLWSVMCASVTSIAVGAIPFVREDLWSNFLVGAVPVTGALLHDLGQTAWMATWYRERASRIFKRDSVSWGQLFGWGLFYSTRIAFVGIAILSAGLQVPAIQRLPDPGLTMLGVLVFVLALYWLWIGGQGAENLKRPQETWFDAFLRSGNTILGTGMLRVFLGTALFIAANAGLRVYGL